MMIRYMFYITKIRYLFLEVFTFLDDFLDRKIQKVLDRRLTLEGAGV